MAAVVFDLNKLDGLEVHPGITIIGKGMPIPGTNLMRCLANIDGQLGLIEVKITFAESKD